MSSKWRRPSSGGPGTGYLAVLERCSKGSWSRITCGTAQSLPNCNQISDARRNVTYYLTTIGNWPLVRHRQLQSSQISVLLLGQLAAACFFSSLSSRLFTLVQSPVTLASALNSSKVWYGAQAINRNTGRALSNFMVSKPSKTLRLIL